MIAHPPIEVLLQPVLPFLLHLLLTAPPSMASNGTPGHRIPVERLVQDAEFAIEGRPLSIRMEKLFFPDEAATTIDLCIIDVEVVSAPVGEITSGRVDLWFPCEEGEASMWLRPGGSGNVETIWFLASRLQGLAMYGRRFEDDPYRDYPYSEDTVVLQSMFSIWQMRANKPYATPAIGDTPVCIDKGAPPDGSDYVEDPDADHVVWCNSPGDMDTVWRVLTTAFDSDTTIAGRSPQ